MVDKEYMQQMAQNIASSPIAFFLRRPHMLVILLVGIALGGIYALKVMPIESDPEVKISVGTVQTIFPGASPSDVEKLVTDEIEDRLEGLDDLKTLTSESREGVSFITAEFEANAPIDESIRDLRDEVDLALPDLPEDAEDPIVTQIRAGDEAILTVAIVGEAPLIEMKQVADDLEEILEDIKGVDRVEIDGLPAREWQVLLNRQALEGFEIFPSTVANAIALNHVDSPVGTIRTNDLLYQVSLKGEFDHAHDLQTLVIAERGGQNVLLSDVAEIREVFGESTSEAHMVEMSTLTSERAISLRLHKKLGADLVAITDKAKVRMNEFEQTMGDDLRLVITDDFSERIRTDISNLLRSAWQTTVIIAIVLFLALGFREAFAAALSIPILYLISMVGLALVGETFNFLTFFALILSLGIVVDTSIVIIEGIYESMQKHHMGSKDAALASVGIFRAPLISGSLTTISAFVPLSLMTGIMGEYVKHIPITVNITLVASLFTALFVLPAVAVRVLHRNGKPHKPPILSKVLIPLGYWYQGFITTLLASRRNQRRWILGTIGAFFLSGVLVMTGIVKFNLFASGDFDVFFVTVRAPEGTTIERTADIADEVEQVVLELPELVRVLTVVGDGSSNKARMTVKLTPTNERRIKSYDLTTKLRKQMSTYTKAEVLVEELETGPPGGADIQVRLLGDDARSTEQFAAVIEDLLAETEGTQDITTDLEIAPGEYHLTPKRDRLELFGITTLDLGSGLRAAVFGDDRTEVNVAGQERDIRVRMDYRSSSCTEIPLNQLLEVKDERTICRSYPKDIAELLDVQIPTSKGQVRIGELVDVELTSAVTTIRHYNTDRAVSVRANVAEGYVLADVLRNFNQGLKDLEIPRGIEVKIGGENEDTAESMRSLANASVIAILLIFAILVYQFQSFRQVFAVLMTMPLAVMGVLYGLALIRFPLSFPGLIGVVALLGIVVNDAIVLVDTFNRNRKLGQDVVTAVGNGCRQRLEPVIMTTLTTALGVLPLIFASEVFRDLAIVVAVGITVATIFTLVILPVLYVAFDRMHGMIVRKLVCTAQANLIKFIQYIIRAAR